MNLFRLFNGKYETKYLCKQIVSTNNSPSQKDWLFHVFQTKYLFIRVLVRSLKLVTCWKDILTSVPSWQTPWPWGPPRLCPLCPGGRPGWMSCPYCHNTSPPPQHSPATHSWRNLTCSKWSSSSFSSSSSSTSSSDLTCSKWLVMMAEPPLGLGYKMLWISVDFWSEWFLQKSYIFSGTAGGELVATSLSLSIILQSLLIILFWSLNLNQCHDMRLEIMPSQCIKFLWSHRMLNVCCFWK